MIGRSIKEYRHQCPRAIGFQRLRFVDSSGLGRIGREEPVEYTLCTVCTEVVQNISQDQVHTYSQNTK